ncbi:MAG: hypothetical protein LBD25_05040 [Coriobacteriales bacterium]|jgi:hypothetical protein|nr:hypothetical protein [Coriobacteriales bacterium]
MADTQDARDTQGLPASQEAAGTQEATDKGVALRGGVPALNESSWGKPQDGALEGRARQRRRHDVLATLLTFFLAVCVIVAGFLVPTLVFPSMDRFGGQTVSLEPLVMASTAVHVFEKQVTLYPWEFYDAGRCRPLYVDERSLLVERNIPGFLLTALRDHGVVPTESESGLRSMILERFRYLETGSAEAGGCFVLILRDASDPDGGLLCAVDLSGNIVSLLFASDNWENVRLDALVTPLESQALPDDDPGHAEESTTPSPAQGFNPGDEAGNTGTALAASQTEQPETTATGQGGPDAPAAADPQAGAGSILFLSGTDLSQWAFAYATAREAQVFQQMPVARAFRLLELNLEKRFGYRFEDLLEGDPLYAPELPDMIQLTYHDLPSPSLFYTRIPATVFESTEYLLNIYIYKLPNNTMLILYSDPLTESCVGFELQSLAGSPQ